MGPHSQVNALWLTGPPAGGRGAGGRREPQRKNKNQSMLQHCLPVIIDKFNLNIYIYIFSKDSLHFLNIPPSLDMKPREKKQKYLCDLASGLYVFVFFPLSLLFDF